jgi:hypothetical protein
MNGHCSSGVTLGQTLGGGTIAFVCHIRRSTLHKWCKIGLCGNSVIFSSEKGGVFEKNAFEITQVCIKVN